MRLAGIRAAILEAGHASADFAILAAGPNGASPHHGTSDRPIGAGEPVVVDIGSGFGGSVAALDSMSRISRVV